MKVAIYCRVSTEHQSLDNQIDLCTKYCEYHGHEVFKIYQDVYTGTKASRPSFNELIEDMRQYKFRAIVCTKLDRVGRSLKHLINLFEEFKNKNVEFVAVTQNIDTISPAGKLLFHIIGAFGEFEAEMISERTKEGLKGKKNVGKRGKDKKPRKSRGTLRK